MTSPLEELRTQLAWRGSNDKRLGHVVLSRDDAEQLIAQIESIDSKLNDVLCEMKPNFDDSITGFNEAWDIVREIFKGAS